MKRTVEKAGKDLLREHRRTLAFAAVAFFTLGVLLGWHAGAAYQRAQPTAAQLFGCTPAQTDPMSGECP